jgi:hypothetical protein
MNKTYAKHYVVVVDEPLVSLELLGLDDCEPYFTTERFLPRILVEIGVFPSVSEVRRNRPDLVRELDKPDWLELKIGKRVVDVVVGRKEEEGDEQS